jgi:hypothetical protein
MGSTCGVFYWAYDEPSIDVTNTTFMAFNMSYNSWGDADAVDLNVAVTVQVQNPSRRPVEFTLKSVNATVYSLDSIAPNQLAVDPVLIGDALLNQEVFIGADSAAELVLSTAAIPEIEQWRCKILGLPFPCPGRANGRELLDYVHLENTTLAHRLDRDCAARNAPHKTQVRVHIKAATLSVFGVSVVVRLDDVHYDFLVPCVPGNA